MNEGPLYSRPKEVHEKMRSKQHTGAKQIKKRLIFKKPLKYKHALILRDKKGITSIKRSRIIVEKKSQHQNWNVTFKEIKDHRRKTAATNTIDNLESNISFQWNESSLSSFDDCKPLCDKIKSESSNIVHVEATYKEDDTKSVIFLIFAEKEIPQITNERRTEIRVLNKYSNESRDALYCTENSQLPEKTSKEIAKIIDKYSKTLMRDHKYLSSISASSVISKQYGTPHYKIVKKPCIVLNVLVKGLIPINEKPFPKQLDNIPVDVREGGVQYCGGGSTDYQNNLRMGCMITSSFTKKNGDKYISKGTLGGFIEHPEYGLCGVTCAHVVLDDGLKHNLKGMSKLQKGDQTDFPAITIYQPEERSGNEIGHVVEVTYKEGGNDRPGVDLALFKIDKRAPINGLFLKNQQVLAIKSFNTGLVWGNSGIPAGQNIVHKFGFATGCTRGALIFDGSAMKEVEFYGEMSVDQNMKLTTTLYKQYHIKSIDDGNTFADLGDSGSLVFMEDKSGGKPIFRCIGMVVAIRKSDNTCFVTPIIPLLEELKVSQLKPFPPQKGNRRVNNRFDKIEKMLKRLQRDVNKLKKN